MALQLSNQQQLDLLHIYLETHLTLMARWESISTSTPANLYEEVNNNFQRKGFALAIKRKVKGSDIAKTSLDIKKQLRNLVCQHIPGNNLYGHFYSLYDQLNTKHHFDSGETRNKRHTISLAISDLIKDYYNEERERAESKAFWDSLFFCLLIITIPFVSLFYNYRKDQHSQNNVFAEMPVSNQHLQAATASMNAKPCSTTTIIEEKVKDALNKKFHTLKEKRYGLLNKTTLCSSSTFKDILFSSKNNVRKSLGTTYRDWNGLTGITLIGTRQQVQDSTKKFETYLQNQRSQKI